MVSQLGSCCIIGSGTIYYYNGSVPGDPTAIRMDAGCFGGIARYCAIYNHESPGVGDAAAACSVIDRFSGIAGDRAVVNSQVAVGAIKNPTAEPATDPHEPSCHCMNGISRYRGVLNRQCSVVRDST